jgi:hypothetical protein
MPCFLLKVEASALGQRASSVEPSALTLVWLEQATKVNTAAAANALLKNFDVFMTIPCTDFNEKNGKHG